MSKSSPWLETPRDSYPPLDRSERFDAVVIGGGITGLTAALRMKQAGLSVCVLEKGRVGGGETGHTTAHLTQITDARLSSLVDTHGEEVARLTWRAGAEAVNVIESITRQLSIDCDFQRVPAFVHASLEKDDDETQGLMRDARLAQSFGFSAEFVTDVPVAGRPGVRFGDQALFHPGKYTQALARAIHGDGSRVCEHSEVKEIKEDPLRVTANNCRLDCSFLVYATHNPTMEQEGFLGQILMQSKLYAYSTYAIGAKLPRGAAPYASYFDTSEPYNYLRVEPGADGDYAIFGGADHKTGHQQDTDACYRKLERLLLKLFPQANIDRRWSGQVVETPDMLPYIGEIGKGQFLGTGYAGNGITFGTLAGMMACDVATGKQNPWQELFAPDRKAFHGIKRFLSENLDFPFYFVADWLPKLGAKSTRSVRRGEGKVLKLDGQSVACFRDEEGNLSQVSAVCTHMGCHVRWNGAERTWDCPCHGSRFLPSGEVMAGPADQPLPPVKKKAKRASRAKSNG